MEGFDLISTGVWSIIPPILALGLALITKEVYSSLAIGVFVGMVIYQFSLNGVGVEPLVDSFTIIIFVDDYFNCLTVGAVMRPVTDRFNISHEKLAWIIDSTAAPICIIAPVSSWAVAVGGYLGEGGFTTFVQSIPYNFYALLTIVFVFFMCATKKDFGPMRVAEAEVQKPADQQHRIPSKDSALESMSTVGISDPNAADALPAKLDTIVAEEDELDEAAKVAVEEFKGMAISDKGRVFDVLIIFSILGMLYAGGFFQGVDFATAVGENPVFGLCIGVCVALVVTAAMFLPRKLMTLSGYMDGVAEGVRSMVGAIMILVLAWSLGGTCRYLLGTGEFVSGFLNSIGVGLALLPVVIFVVAAFIGFAMGTSWGTIALILPIVIGVFPAHRRHAGRCGVRRPCVAYFGYHHSVVGGRAVQPPAPCGYAAAVRFGGGGRVSGGLHHRRLHGQPVDRARRGRRADDRGCAGAEPLEVRGGEGVSANAGKRASEAQRAPGTATPPRALFCARSRPVSPGVACAQRRSPPAAPASPRARRRAPRVAALRIFPARRARVAPRAMANAPRRPARRARQMYGCFT